MIMENKFKGILLYRKISKENNLFIKFLSENDEIITGIVFGGLSSKNKNLYQLGNFFQFNLSSKKLNFPYSIKGELDQPYLSSVINDKYKLNCIMAIVAVLNLSIIEGQKIKGIFSTTEKMISLLILKKNWLIDFIKYLYNLLKIIGYDTDYENNSKNPFFDIVSLKFSSLKDNKSLLFPHKLFNDKISVNYESVKLAFIIFEEIFQNNHLINMNLKLPISFIKFRDLILTFLKNKNDKTN
ncbi:MAG: hypothetical protein CFH15_00931 [Alphaproteobacteria bacterium MarineAlpha5_Bin5]|nr:MAG: hypothetical protein CFH15_00931 [Alphaproteobacteria bacterium MarineAlpha5_Bin5]PPR52325.1 MAG: hypothetical protein CFH14_00456 [Alphaproteobacteria bacterium MarineAlpha5_Bin4]|tara:strand:- start:2705 stop:3427 length:723 start_codon:yes stop_codon:yes gene_type:complete